MLRNLFLGLLTLCISCSAYANKVNFVPLDTWGDNSYSEIVVDNQKAYVASEGLIIFDVSDDTQITELGRVKVDSYQFMKSIRVVGNQVILIEHDKIYLIDVTDSSQPVISGTIDYPGANGFTDAVVLNDVLYASGQDQSLVYAYNIADPAAPALLKSKSMSNISTNGVSLGLVDDKVIYAGYEGISILSTEADTRLDSLYSVSQDVNNFVSRIPSKSKVAYFVNGADFLVYDFSDLSNVSTTTVTPGSSNIADISLSGDSLVVIDSSGKGYHYDISVAATPSLQAQGGSSFSNAELSSDSQHAYLLSSSKGIEIRDLSNFTTTAEYNKSGTLFDLDIYQDKLAVASGDAGLRLFDLSGSSIQLTEQETSGYFNSAEFVENYLLDSRQSIRNTGAASPLANVAYYSKTSDGTGFVKMEDAGDRLILATLAGISILNVSDPVNPVELGYISASTYTAGTSNQNTALKVVGNIVYAGTMAGAFALDISDPSNIQYSSRIGPSSTVKSLEVKDNSLLVAYSSILNSYDVTDPMAASYQSQALLPSANNTESVRVYKNWAILDSTAENVITVDISDPTSISDYEVHNSGNVPLSREIGIYNNEALFISQGQIKRFQINEAPVVSNSSHSIDEDTTLSANLDVTDPEADSVELSVVTQPQNGSLTISNGAFEYVPNENYFGSDSFEYQALDPHGGDASAIVSLNINSVNDLPQAESSEFSLNEDVALSETLQASDVEDDSLVFAVVSSTSSGTLEVDENGNLNYLPEANFFGNDSFTYSATDSDGGVAEQTVTLTIVPVNDLPVITSTSFSTDEDVQLTSAIEGEDIEGEALTFELVENARNGAITLTENGGFEYLPSENFNGEDSFTVRANDGNEVGETTTVTINVAAINDAPVASDDAITVQEGNSVTREFISSDIDGDELSFAIESEPAQGNLTLNGSQYSYQAAEGSTGTQQFTFSVSDDDGLSSTATITITVTSRPEPSSSSSGGGGAFGALLVLAGLVLLRRRIIS